MTAKDARIRRTRKYLEESLLSLMTTKSIKDITVRELTERARLAEIFFNSGCVAILQNWVKNGEGINSTAVLRLMFQLVLTGARGFVEDK